MLKKYWLALLVVILLSGLALMRFLSPEDTWLCQNNVWVKHGQPSAPQPLTGCGQNKACTMEAKICSDGSSVGRSGPNCEFAACPNIDQNNQPDWLTYKSTTSSLQFQYPATLSTQYTTPQDWPPKVTVTKGKFTCQAQDGTASLPNRTTKRLVDNRVYCVEAMSEGAAGSTYTNYIYTTQKEDKIITVAFTLRYPQCLNYDQPKQSACVKEREAFDLDGVIDRLVKTIKF